ncbi:MAG: signal recognition particle-docking protein FtsY [Succinivibrionaceae bacterium]
MLKKNLFSFLGSKNKSNETETQSFKSSVNEQSSDKIKDRNSSKEGIFKKFLNGLKKTRDNFGGEIISLFRGKKIDDELLEEIETVLLTSDVGVETTEKLIKKLTEEIKLKDLKNSEVLFDALSQELYSIVNKVAKPLDISKGSGTFVILMVGVNGVGKTTTIGKLSKILQEKGLSVMLAAGDTFRAAAVEQLKEWGERNNIHVVSQSEGADSASVIYDAYNKAIAKKIDVLIADTAGRLQNKSNLMEELRKIVRVIKKIDANAPHEVMLTVDACTGQNILNQVKLFNDIVPITGLNITKLDGTAKGGVIFNVADKYQIPIRYIGVGEAIEDLREFNSHDFINAIFTDK